LKSADEILSLHPVHSEERKWVGIVCHQNRCNPLEDLKIHWWSRLGANLTGSAAIVSFVQWPAALKAASPQNDTMHINLESGRAIDLDQGSYGHHTPGLHNLRMTRGQKCGSCL
jgi:hypothetical protein